MSAEIPTSMWAWRKQQGTTEPVWEEVPVPAVPPHGYLIRVLAAGVCHSDYVLVNSPKLPPNYPQKFTLGHESCGVVAGIGSDVKGGAFKLGDKVAVFSVPGCGGAGCQECSQGHPQLCVQGERYGLGSNGSFTEYVAVTSRALVPLPEGVAPTVGAVATDAVVTGFHAVFRRGGIKKGDTVLLFGLGGLGFNALQMMLARGIRVIASDVKEEMVKAAIAQGVPEDDVVPVDKTPQQFFKEKSLEGKIDVVLDFVGVKQTFTDAQFMVRRGGTVVAIGGIAPETSVNMQLCLTKGISILFSHGGHREDLEEALQMISQRQIDPQVKLQRLEEFPNVLADLHAGKITGRVALAPKGIDADLATGTHKAERL